MPGTKHFTRMQYNVARGLREIIAPRQTMSKADWMHVLREFGAACIFCGRKGTAANRGIVPDHLIPASKFGELVLGNTVPACQTCNDGRGEKAWRPFLRTKFPGDAEAQIASVERHLSKYDYQPASLERALSTEEKNAYLALLQEWEKLLTRAKALRDAAEMRRKDAAQQVQQ